MQKIKLRVQKIKMLKIKKLNIFAATNDFNSWIGNPGKEFENTCHNVGFDIIDSIQKHFLFQIFKKLTALIQKNNESEVILFKPMKFMNLSGEPIYKILIFNIEKADSIVVFHDDLDLKFLKIRIKLMVGMVAIMV